MHEPRYCNYKPMQSAHQIGHCTWLEFKSILTIVENAQKLAGNGFLKFNWLSVLVYSVILFLGVFQY